MSAVLEIRNLSVRFATDDGPVQAVDDLSLSVGQGDIVGVVGESGCGKSVTALTAAGLLPPAARVTSGSVLLDGVDLLTLGRKPLRDTRGKAISMVFQEPMTSLNPVMTIGRQISEVLRRHEGLGKGQARERAAELLATVGIAAPAQRLAEYPHQLSGGMRQRVMMAIAIACHPKVLIADEPTTALDVTIQAGILDTLRSLRDRFGMAIVLITHDLGVVADVTDRVAVMYSGRKIEEASTRELFARPRHPYVNGLLAAMPRSGASVGVTGRRRLAEIPGVVPTLSGPADCCAFNPRCPHAMDVCRSQLPVLADVGEAHRVACFYSGRAAAVAGRGHE
jgi:peptide/nickel transport system ATP-binding protein